VLGSYIKIVNRELYLRKNDDDNDDKNDGYDDYDDDNNNNSYKS
jgi:hypothetical protein